MSQRAAAKLLGVSDWTIRHDLQGDLAESASKPRTGSAATKAHREETAAPRTRSPMRNLRTGDSSDATAGEAERGQSA